MIESTIRQCVIRPVPGADPLVMSEGHLGGRQTGGETGQETGCYGSVCLGFVHVDVPVYYAVPQVTVFTWRTETASRRLLCRSLACWPAADKRDTAFPIANSTRQPITLTCGSACTVTVHSTDPYEIHHSPFLHFSHPLSSQPRPSVAFLLTYLRTDRYHPSIPGNPAVITGRRQHSNQRTCAPSSPTIYTILLFSSQLTTRYFTFLPHPSL